MDVTVLFLDVAGYTRISETQSRDKVTFIIEKYFSSFLDIIYVHGGDINETAGDGLMVIFQGDPINTALSAVKQRWKFEQDLGDQRRIEESISAGRGEYGYQLWHGSCGNEPIQGTSGTRMTFTATGPVTNLAARIASAAKHGDILVGPETASRVGGDIKLFGRGLMNFKNVSEPVQVFSMVRDRENED